MPPIRLFSENLSRLPGVVHGFSSQLTMRTTAAPPDDPPCWRPRQVHGPDLVELDRLDRSPDEADGVLCRVLGIPIGIVTADCVPVLLAASDGSRVAAIHSGWRGMAAGILEAAVERLDAACWHAAIGPSAGGCCYQVGAEVLDALEPAPERVHRREPSGRAHLDLRALAADRLRKLGPAASVEMVGPCSICSDSWPSYRREGKKAGRALAWIARAPLSLSK